MNDDFNTALTIAHLFNLSKRINSIHNGHLSMGAVGEDTFILMKNTYIDFVEKVLGLKEEKPQDHELLINTLIELYTEAKFRKEYDKVDVIRARLREGGILLKDMKTGVEWAYEE